MNVPYLILNVFGGLAIFIFGMKMMSDGLHVVAGDKMRSILKLFSSNRFVAVLSGTVVTAVVQSSSASTVMVIGFVNAGLLNLVQAIGIIFGANIGTTITAQLVAFEISWVIMPAIILGLLMTFIPRRTVLGWGETIIGLGFLFLGMQLMSDELKQLSSHPMFMQAFQVFKCAPVDGVMPPLSVLGAIAIGLVVTMVIQSSSAATGIIIALGASGLLDLYTAMALVLGSNIGTTVTAQLAAIAANRVAKQAALAHTLFNVIGVLLITGTFWITWDGTPIFFKFVNWISADGDLPRRIANAHTLFNVVTASLLVPFVPLMALVCEKLIPLKTQKIKYQRLEPTLLETPTIALSQTSSALRKMLKKAWKMVDCAFGTYYGEEIDADLIRQLDEREKGIDQRQNNITNYLSNLMMKSLSKEQASQIPLLLHCTNDAERIGDHTSIILDIVKKLKSTSLKFSETAEAEFAKLRSELSAQAQCCFALLEMHTDENMKAAEDLKISIIKLANEFEEAHIQRINANQCRCEVGILYLELLAEVRKISRHLANITDRAGNFYGNLKKFKVDKSEKIIKLDKIAETKVSEIQI